jgi:hypothetical protein
MAEPSRRLSAQIPRRAPTEGEIAAPEIRSVAPPQGRVPKEVRRSPEKRAIPPKEGEITPVEREIAKIQGQAHRKARISEIQG